MGLTLFVRGIPPVVVVVLVEIGFSGSGMMSSGVDRERGEVDEETAPNPFRRVLLMFRLAGEFGRTNIPLPLVIVESPWKIRLCKSKFIQS